MRRALATGNPLLVRAAAAELERVDLEDALAISVVLLESEPERYEPAAVRWLGRFLLERRGTALLNAEALAANLAALRHPGRSRLAALELGELCYDAGLKRAGKLLEQRSEQGRGGVAERADSRPTCPRRFGGEPCEHLAVTRPGAHQQPIVLPASLGEQLGLLREQALVAGDHLRAVASPPIRNRLPHFGGSM